MEVFRCNWRTQFWLEIKMSKFWQIPSSKDSMISVTRLTTISSNPTPTTRKIKMSKPKIYKISNLISLMERRSPQEGRRENNKFNKNKRDSSKWGRTRSFCSERKWTKSESATNRGYWFKETRRIKKSCSQNFKPTMKTTFQEIWANLTYTSITKRAQFSCRSTTDWFPSTSLAWKM